MAVDAQSNAKRRYTYQAEAARREEILDAATQLFAEHGFTDAVTQALADRLKVGKGTIYRHFSSKRELFLAATDRVMRLMQETVDERLVGVQDGLERVYRGVETFLTFFAENPRYVELLIQERAYFRDRAVPTCVEHRRQASKAWREVYTRLIAEGRFRELPPERISDVIGNLIYGTMFTNHFAGTNRPVAEQVRELLDVLLAGLLSESERERLREFEARSA